MEERQRTTTSRRAAEYAEASIRVLKGLEPVKQRPGMYTRTDSPLLVVQEVIDNASDEILAGSGTRIDVTLHKDGAVSVEDDGRGIPAGLHPEEKAPVVEIVFTRLHAGGKFDKRAGGAYSFSGGLHGVGVSVTNALASRLDVIVWRDGKMHTLARVYQYWIALSDCDGFRADAVKHVSVQASQRFCTAIHEYAESIGKENFFITGEITDGAIAPGYGDLFGGTLDAGLGIIAFPNRLPAMLKGSLDPSEFFSLYDEHTPFGTFRQQGRYIVAVLDDHDMSSRGHKARFAAHGRAAIIYQPAAHVVGVQVTTPGMPSIYYGTEQALDGTEDCIITFANGVGMGACNEYGKRA